MAKFSSEQIKEILAIHENTLMKFFTSSMERLKNKIERFSNENTLLKQEVESLKAGADFFSGFTEKAQGAETWEKSEDLIRGFIEGNLEMESKDMTIERAHRTGSKINGKKRAINVQFLNYKGKDAILNHYRQKQLSKDNIYVNDDYSEHTAELRKQLL